LSSVSCECRVFSGRDLCDELITRPETSYRLWCVVVCDLETSWMRRPWPTGGCRTKNKQTNKLVFHPVAVIGKLVQKYEGKSENKVPYFIATK
jgi:hypothetical protein